MGFTKSMFMACMDNFKLCVGIIANEYSFVGSIWSQLLKMENLTNPTGYEVENK